MEFLVRSSVDYAVEGHTLYEIVNFNEYLVLEAMRDVYSRDPALCTCSICVEDVYALSLNSLPPRYIQATSTQTYTTSKHYVDLEKVKEVVLDAAGKVHKRPGH